MATIKSYTDIEQSKVLAEILPLDSADYFYKYCIGHYNTIHYRLEMYPYNKGGNKNHDIPCWSLAALLDLLPPYLYEFDRGIDLNIYRNLNGKGWHCSYMPNCIENMKKDKFKLITNGDNLVDACYEMIVELKERNLI